MSFNSIPYILILPALIGLNRVLPPALRRIFLLAASYVFYAAFDLWFCLPLLFSTLIDYFCGLKISASSDFRTRRSWLWLSLAANLSMLFTFKYHNFFVDQACSLLGRLGFQADPWIIGLAMPVGISFYTFQSLSYSIDIYRGITRPAGSFLDFALYVAFFPQLLAGPIERSGDLLPQIEKLATPTRKQFRSGFFLVLLGYWKKVVIADQMGLIVAPTFGSPGAVDGTHMLIATYAYVFQVYGDFSGYSDIARGTAKMLGVDLVLNFRMPFFAKNIQDYWNRWHISLSHWMRDYLFQPLVRTGLKPALAAFATMVLIGIWHGAAWKYLVFGIWHGLLLALFDRTRRLRRQLSGHLPPRLWKMLGTLATFHAAWLGLSIFGCKWLGRWPDMAETIVNHMVWDRDGGILLTKMIYFISPLLLLHAVQERRGYDFHEGCRGPLRLFLCGALLLSILHHGVVEGGVFVYFQF